MALNSARINGSIYLSSGTLGPLLLEGTVTLTRATCGGLRLTREQAQSLHMAMDGLTYQGLWPASPRDMLAALDREDPPPRLAYSQLAKHADDLGDGALRRDVLVRMEDRLTAREPARSLTGFRRRLLGLLVGYGYRPGRAAILLLLCIAVAATTAAVGGPAYLRPSNSVRPSTAVISTHEAVAYAIDSLVPFLSFGNNDHWQISVSTDGGYAWLATLYFLKVLAWGFAALWAASIAGLVRRAP